MAKITSTTRRKFRTRNKIKRVNVQRIGNRTTRARLSVFRSNKGMYAQIIDDVNGVTLASASTIEIDAKSKSNVEAAKKVGALIAEKAKKAKVELVVFDRGPFRYHGRVKALADAAREGGLKF